ncbi:MAG: 50S ribosomal protein L21 [Fidelibacterota bacterium]
MGGDMYAIVNISGRQFRVEPGDRVMVPHQSADPGEKITFDTVLLMDDGKKVKVGTPRVPSSTVEATVLEHGRTKKVPVFKKKRRKGYRVKNTHRQDFTLIRVDSIKQKAAKKSKASPAKQSAAQTAKSA